MEKITLNNKTYILEADVKKSKNTIPSKKQIVILNRGWVIVGDYSEKGDECLVKNASVVRVWGTSKGIGELAENGPLSNTKLDPCPDVRFHKLTMVARIDCNEDKWN